jgi:transcriptional antiterminator Rof (Rho-off)
MSHLITTRLALVSMFALAALPAFAKDGVQVQAEADNKETQAAANRDIAAAESARSKAAQMAGKSGCAAKYEQRAAEETKDANKLSAKAADLQIKADQKETEESK